MSTFIQDLRFGARVLVKSPGFTLAAVATLALGIGVNSAIFSVVNAMLLRPLPVRAPEEIVTISKVDNHVQFPHGMSYVDFLDHREQVDVFDDLLAYTFAPVNFATDEGSERMFINVVSGNYFSALGVDTVVGRTFLPEEDRPHGAVPVLVLSYGTWQDRFGGDPGVVGRVVRLNGQPYTVIGVVAESFQGLHSLIEAQAFAPLTSIEELRPDAAGTLTARGAEGLFVVGRLADGRTVADAQAAMGVQAARFAEAYPQTHEDSTYLVLPELLSRPEPATSTLTPLVGSVMMGLAALVLLIACANVAGLLFARGVTRAREMAVRAALGAGRTRLVVQLLSESLLLAILGGGAGVVVAIWTSRALGAVRFAADIPVRFDVGLDWRVLAFTAVVAVVTGVVAGVTPALQASRADLAERLKEGGRSSADAPGRQRARSALVVAQVAISLFLLVCAGLFIQSLRSAEQLDMGFRTDNLLLLSVDPVSHGYDETRGRALYRATADEMAAVPGVRSVSWARYTPFGSSGAPLANFVTEDRVATTMEDPAVILFNYVNADYFTTLDTSVVRGRGFENEDREDGRPVAVINQSAAERLWPGQDPIGRRFQAELGETYSDPIEVVGVAEDAL